MSDKIKVQVYEIEFNPDYNNYESEEAYDTEYNENFAWMENPPAKDKFTKPGHATLLGYADRKRWVSSEELLELHAHKLKFEVKTVKDIYLGSKDIFQHTAEDKMPVQMVEQAAYYNNKCEVHMPGQALSFYNELLLKEDCCTDVLNEELCKGWRIVAACPQPDQRRPDYILGRFTPGLGE